VIDIAIELDIIHKAGGWFTFVNRYNVTNEETGEVSTVEEILQRVNEEDGESSDIKVQGQPNILPFLKKPENEYILNMIEEKVSEKIVG
jgi:hypothetical protein